MKQSTIEKNVVKSTRKPRKSNIQQNNKPDKKQNKKFKSEDYICGVCGKACRLTYLAEVKDNNRISKKWMCEECYLDNKKNK